MINMILLGATGKRTTNDERQQWSIASLWHFKRIYLTFTYARLPQDCCQFGPALSSVGDTTTRYLLSLFTWLLLGAVGHQITWRLAYRAHQPVDKAMDEASPLFSHPYMTVESFNVKAHWKLKLKFIESLNKLENSNDCRNCWKIM